MIGSGEPRDEKCHYSVADELVDDAVAVVDRDSRGPRRSEP